MNRFLSIFSIVLFTLTVENANAQTVSDDSLTKLLAERYRKIAAAKMSRPGYRIQIYFGTDRVRANEIRAEFMRFYPETGAYLVYQQPNFKVRVGDFRTRLEAQGFHHSIADRYTPSFIVPDEVRLPNFD